MVNNLKLVILIVTHNSEQYIPKCISSLLAQGDKNFKLIIYDSGSKSNEYLKPYLSYANITLMFNNENVGFCKANNLVTNLVEKNCDYIIYLNPDIILPNNFIELIKKYLFSIAMANVGVIGIKLLRYDIVTDSKTNTIDSTGIFQTWYGHWFDRGQGEIDYNKYETNSKGELVPAICGALMICKMEALRKVELEKGEYFRNSFFMYKEDIDLSLRINRAGFLIKYNPKIIAWHGRGWQKRKQMSKQAKLLSAKNEIVINRSLNIIKYLYSIMKYIIANLLTF